MGEKSVGFLLMGLTDVLRKGYCRLGVRTVEYKGLECLQESEKEIVVKLSAEVEKYPSGLPWWELTAKLVETLPGELQKMKVQMEADLTVIVAQAVRRSNDR